MFMQQFLQYYQRCLKVKSYAGKRIYISSLKKIKQNTKTFSLASELEVTGSGAASNSNPARCQCCVLSLTFPQTKGGAH